MCKQYCLYTTFPLFNVKPIKFIYDIPNTIKEKNIDTGK